MTLGNQQDKNNTASRQKQTISQLAQSGDITKARQLCTTLCEQAPGDAEAWFLLGAISGAVSDYPEAEACCKKAIALAPEQPMLRYNLAVALLKQEKANDAIEQLEHTIRLQPDFADAHRELGNAQSMAGEPLLAILNYKRSVKLDPDPASTHYNLGNAYRSLNRLDEAAESFRHAITLQPDLVDAYAGLANVLISQYKFDAVINILEEATERLANVAPLFPLLAVAYQEQGDADIALKFYEKTLSIEPDSVDAKAGLAGVLALQGRYAEAGELLEPLLANNPGNATVKTTYATFAHQFGASDRAIEMAENELNNSDVTPKTKARYHFALAHLYEKKEELDTAFEHYVEGNRLRDAQFNYTSYEQMFHAIMDTYSREALALLPRSGNTSDNFIFIVGMPRSGTSLVEHILASHPQVFGAGELNDINYMIDKLPHTLNSSLPYPLCLENLTTEVLNQLADQYQENLFERSAGTGSYFTDKMPINFMHLGFISLLFPNARFIHCTRDPRDTCLSCFFKHFSGELPYAYSLTDLGNFYRLYQRIMAHWEQVLPAPIFELNYEKLVLNQESETRKLVGFCGLEWDETCLNFHETDRTVATASHDQVRQPMYTKSIGRWRAYEKHLEPLLSALRIDT